MQCETAEDLIAYAKTEGVDLTKEEAEQHLPHVNIISNVARIYHTQLSLRGVFFCLFIRDFTGFWGTIFKKITFSLLLNHE